MMASPSLRSGSSTAPWRHERRYTIPKITERLVKAGYTEAQLGNFWSGNALRVLGKAHDARKQAG